MVAFIGVVHILFALLLIVLVLVQDSKGGAMGGVFGGGGSGSLLGATGGANLVVKITRYTAVLFAATCIVLTVISGQKKSSVVDDYVPSGPSGIAPSPSKEPENSKAESGAMKTETQDQTKAATESRKAKDEAANEASGKATEPTEDQSSK